MEADTVTGPAGRTAGGVSSATDSVRDFVSIGSHLTPTARLGMRFAALSIGR